VEKPFRTTENPKPETQADVEPHVIPLSPEGSPKPLTTEQQTDELQHEHSKLIPWPPAENGPKPFRVK
jgi:hypothetical protein